MKQKEQGVTLPDGFDDTTGLDVADAVVKSVLVRFNRLYATARQQAACAGLAPDEAQECALSFAARVLQKHGCAPQLDAWLRRCARNYARNFRRTLARRQSHERCWKAARDYLALPHPPQTIYLQPSVGHHCESDSASGDVRHPENF